MKNIIVSADNFDIYDFENLADTILSLTQQSRSKCLNNNNRFAILKLPPVFTSKINIQGRKNLIAMLKTISRYENDVVLTLSDLPKIYNGYGGMPLLNVQDMRRVHNWVHQINFAIRAAAIEQEIVKTSLGSAQTDVAEVVYKKIYGGLKRRTFVTYAPNSRYTLKPLRYASADAIRRWIRQECAQRSAWEPGSRYGAQPTPQEWDLYGLRGQGRSVCAAIKARLERMLIAALNYDLDGDYTEADALDSRILLMEANLEYFDRLES